MINWRKRINEKGLFCRMYKIYDMVLELKACDTVYDNPMHTTN